MCEDQRRFLGKRSGHRFLRRRLCGNGGFSAEENILEWRVRYGDFNNHPRGVVAIYQQDKADTDNREEANQGWRNQTTVEGWLVVHNEWKSF